jgi:hypothetical protein
MPNTPFNPPPGMVSDETTYNAPGRWLKGSWVRFWEGNWQVKGGYESMGIPNLGGVCRSVLGWQDVNGNACLGFGIHNGLGFWSGGQYSNITPTGFTAGSIDGTGSAGYGTGLYGENSSYGQPSPSNALIYFPLTWSLAAWGGTLMANPRGQTIYKFTPGDALATPVTNAPTQVTYMLVNPQRQVMAFGCNEEVSGTFNQLCIRWSDIEDYTDWTTASNNNAGEYVLESGGRIVCARIVGDYVLVWTTISLYLGTFLGAPGQTWKFERQGSQCGSISPGCPVIKSQTAAWISPDHQVWSYLLGGAPAISPCSIRSMFADHIALGQFDKIVGATTQLYGEATWWYPDARDGLENSRAITVGLDGWYPDLIARTAYCDAGPQEQPIGVSPDGVVYWHEKGNTADGQPLAGFLESADFYLGDAEGGILVTGIWPDFKNQQGPMNVSIFGRDWPQDAERTYGPWPLTPGQQQKSFRMAKRIARVRFDFNSAPAYARGGKPEFQTDAIGGR